MKLSNYNIFVTRNNNVICYNTFEDTLIAISETTYNAFLKFENNLAAFQISKPDLYNAFFDNGFIVSDDKDELNEIRYINKQATYGSKEYSLTLMPSMDCNLNCWYCFETHVQHSKMSEDVQRRIVKHIENKLKRNEMDSLVLDLFGGEPLLNFSEVAYPLAKSLKQLLESYHLPYYTFFVTNGSLISPEIIPRLEEINSRFQITLDGNKKRHNLIRHYKRDKEGTYEKIIAAIYNITENINDTFINIRINYDQKTLLNFEEIVEDLININRKKVRVHLERVWQLNHKIDKDNEQLKKAITLLIANKFEVSYSNFRLRPYSCKTDKLNQASINYDGSVYKCSGRDFTEKHCDGFLNDEGEIEWFHDKLTRRIGLSTFENEMCRDCKLLPICMGPCSQKILERHGRFLEKVCTLNMLEMSLEDYVLFRYNNSFTTQELSQHEKIKFAV